MASMTRKQFFSEAIRQSVRFSFELADAVRPSAEPSKVLTDDTLGADFPPELLAAEAERLGLDPRDRQAVLAAIREKLKAPSCRS